jgi:outer membrane protein OmpA-like peptidoglycan-associated protein
MNITSTAILGLLICGGCAGSVPRELKDARATYSRAAAGPPARESPAQLHVAAQALAVAEKTYEDEGDSDKARDRAYVAMRKAQLAEAQARIAQSEREMAESIKRGQIAQARAQAETRNQLANTTTALNSERQARAEAERRARDALAALEGFASVKKDVRGTVITLPGGVLFTSGKSQLLPAARAKLTEVATALAKDPDATIMVEGYTDSRGGPEMNQQLSTSRARTVRDFLVSKGIAADHITSEGFGMSQPVADNASAEGRANNRRVEIVVHPGSSGAIGGGKPMP